MKLSETVAIHASAEKVWRIITDIDHAAERISAIESIEVLERPEGNELIGLKWRETRIMFGKSATETMWITDAQTNRFYTTRAENHGAVYRSTLSLEEADEQTCLTMTFEAEIQGWLARIMAATLGRFFANATRKAVKQDLQDIKKAAEAD